MRLVILLCSWFHFREKEPTAVRWLALSCIAARLPLVMSSFPKFGRGKTTLIAAALDTRHCGNGIAVAGEELCVRVRGEGHRKK